MLTLRESELAQRIRRIVQPSNTLAVSLLELEPVPERCRPDQTG